MRVINFSQNWNSKLNCTCFTTIRPAVDYYCIGSKYNIYLNKTFVKTVCIVDIKSFYLKDITVFISSLDAGLSVPDFHLLMNSFYSARPSTLNGLFYLILLKSI